MTAALQLARRALAAAGADAEAVVQRERSGMARFAASEVHQPTLIENEVVQVRVLLPDGRAGVAVGNRVDDDGLAALGARAREAAESAPQDPDSAGLAEPAPLPDVEGCDEATAALGAEAQARAAAEAIGAAALPVYGFFTSAVSELAVASSTGIEAEQRLTDATLTVLAAAEAIGAAALPVYGFFTSAVSELAIASSTGIEAEQRLTDATLTVLAATEDASGWATRTSWRAEELDLEACAREAVEKAERTRGAAGLEPGSYRAVLEPYALGELIETFGYSCFSGLALLEERSFFAGRLGERIFDEKISIADDALDPRGLPKALDFEGVPKQRVQLAETGVALGVVWDRDSGKRGGHESTGHALPAPLRSWGPLPYALSLEGGEAESVDELAALVGDGIYVTRVHYLGTVAPREGILTGTTRDGTFRIRGGEIAEPLVNLRFTLSMPELLADVPGLTRKRALVNQDDFYDERHPHATLVPALATASFAITGAGAAPGL